LGRTLAEEQLPKRVRIGQRLVREVNDGA